MTLQEKFEIWDTTHPKIEEMRAYLDRLCGKMPLPLFYATEDGEKLTTDFLPDEKDRLIGILLDENTLLHIKPLAFEDARCLIGDRLFSDIRENDVNYWLKKQFADIPDIHVATEKDIALVNKVCSKLSATLEALDYHGVKIPKPCWGHLGWVEKNSSFVKYWDGQSVLYYYLKDDGDLLVFSSYKKS